MRANPPANIDWLKESLIISTGERSLIEPEMPKRQDFRYCKFRNNVIASLFIVAELIIMFLLHQPSTIAFRENNISRNEMVSSTSFPSFIFPLSNNIKYVKT